MVNKKLLITMFGQLNTKEIKKYLRYKKLKGIGEVTAYALAKKDKFTRELIKTKLGVGKKWKMNIY